MPDFTVGQRKQGIPAFAYDDLGSRWYYLRMFSVNPMKNEPHIVAVYRQIIHQGWDKNFNWISEWHYSEDYEAWNNGQCRIGNGGPGGVFESLVDAKEFARKRFDKLSGIWPIIEDKTAIDMVAVPSLTRR